MKTSQWYNIVKQSSDVRRFHTNQMMSPQNVGEHSYSTALMAFHLAIEFLAEFDHIDDTEIDENNVMLYMLLHDMAEQFTGDLPGNIKADNNGIQYSMEELEREWEEKHLPFDFPILNDREKVICKIVDLYDCFRVADREVGCGNAPMKRTKMNTWFAIIDYIEVQKEKGIITTKEVDFFIQQLTS